MFEIFEHTADLGLRIRAPSLETLFEDAAKGLFSMFVANLDTVRPVVERRLQIAGAERDYLLFDWLSELLYACESEKLLFAEFEVHFDEQGLNAVARGEAIDETRHRLEHEVKAITYHRLKVEQTAEDWFAELIVDI